MSWIDLREFTYDVVTMTTLGDCCGTSAGIGARMLASTTLSSAPKQPFGVPMLACLRDSRL